jgi:neurofibromin 1
VSQREADLRELVVTGLSHLVKANPAYGFKHCFSLAYDQDIRKQIIFARVFARVLADGTKFESPGSAGLIKRSPLSEVSKRLMCWLLVLMLRFQLVKQPDVSSDMVSF